MVPITDFFSFMFRSCIVLPFHRRFGLFTMFCSSGFLGSLPFSLEHIGRRRIEIGMVHNKPSLIHFLFKLFEAIADLKRKVRLGFLFTSCAKGQCRVLYKLNGLILCVAVWRSDFVEPNRSAGWSNQLIIFSIQLTVEKHSVSMKTMTFFWSNHILREHSDTG